MSSLPRPLLAPSSRFLGRATLTRLPPLKHAGLVPRQNVHETLLLAPFNPSGPHSKVTFSQKPALTPRGTQPPSPPPAVLGHRSRLCPSQPLITVCNCLVRLFDYVFVVGVSTLEPQCMGTGIASAVFINHSPPDSSHGQLGHGRTVLSICSAPLSPTLPPEQPRSDPTGALNSISEKKRSPSTPFTSRSGTGILGNRRRAQQR